MRQLEHQRAEVSARAASFTEAAGLPPDELLRLARSVEREMKSAARELEFERAAELRDRLVQLRRQLDGEGEETGLAGAGATGGGRPARGQRPRRRRQGP